MSHYFLDLISSHKWSCCWGSESLPQIVSVDQILRLSKVSLLFGLGNHSYKEIFLPKHLLKHWEQRYRAKLWVYFNTSLLKWWVSLWLTGGQISVGRAVQETSQHSVTLQLIIHGKQNGLKIFSLQIQSTSLKPDALSMFSAPSFFSAFSWVKFSYF